MDVFSRTVLIAHTSKTTITWLKNNAEHYISKEYWSPNSPDLSPIENVWAMAASKPAQNSKHMMALERRLRKYWRLISLTTVQNLIGSMHDRLKASIRNKGDTNIRALS